MIWLKTPNFGCCERWLHMMQGLIENPVIVATNTARKIVLKPPVADNRWQTMDKWLSHPLQGRAPLHADPS